MLFTIEIGHLAMQSNMNCSCKNELKSQDDMRSQVGKGRIGKQVQFGGREKIGEDFFSVKLVGQNNQCGEERSC